MWEPCLDSDTDQPAVKRSFRDKGGHFHMESVFRKGIIVNFVHRDNGSVVKSLLSPCSFGYILIFVARNDAWEICFKISPILLGTSWEKL